MCTGPTCTQALRAMGIDISHLQEWSNVVWRTAMSMLTMSLPTYHRLKILKSLFRFYTRQKCASVPFYFPVSNSFNMASSLPQPFIVIRTSHISKHDSWSLYTDVRLSWVRMHDTLTLHTTMSKHTSIAWAAQNHDTDVEPNIENRIES